MDQNALTPHALRVADLSPSSREEIDIVPGNAELAELAEQLDLLDLRKLRLRGVLEPLGKQDWQFTGQLGATVVQPCVATLAPVKTRIETEVQRQFMRDFVEPDSPEAEMPEDDTSEALSTHIDPGQIMAEALSLALPLYPRADGADPVVLRVTEPGKAAMQDEDTKPFAGLADLRTRLAGPKDD